MAYHGKENSAVGLDGGGGDTDSRTLKEKHQQLAGVVKGVHAKLRRKFHQSRDIDGVWKEHCQDSSLLSEYADAMHHLATEIWTKHPETRIEWCQKTCVEYFFHGGLQKVIEKEERKKLYNSKQNSSKENVQKKISQRTRSKSEERCIAAEEAKDNNVPSINVLSVSATQITDYLCHASSNIEGTGTNEGLAIDRPCNIQSLSSDGTSIMDDTSSPEVESVSQNGDQKCNSLPRVHRERVGHGTARSSGSEHTETSEADLIFGYPEGMEPDRATMLAHYNPHRYNTITLPFKEKIRLIDVGSCFNPFQKFDEFQALGIDISPAVESVYYCDFLHLEMTDPLQLAPDSVGTFLRNLKSPIESLPSETFHVVVFSLLLEYFPSTYQRWICCQKAHQLLTINGILIIITPDSHNQNRNAPMIKSWKKAIQSLGFSRWRYVKLEHLHCMVFRKIPKLEEQHSNLVKDVGPDMLYIPQDFNDAQGDENLNSAYLFGSVPRSEDESCFFMNNFDELPAFVDGI